MEPHIWIMIQSTNTTSGALFVDGDVGIGKDVNIGGNLYVATLEQTIISGQTVITKNDPSYSLNSGSLSVAGGAAIEGNLTW